MGMIFNHLFFLLKGDKYMYYVIDNNRFINTDKIDMSKQNIAIFTLDEFGKEYRNLNIKDECYILCKNSKMKFLDRFEIYEDFCFTSLEIFNLSFSKRSTSKVIFIIKNNLFIIIVLQDSSRFMGNVLKNSLNINMENLTLERFISILYNHMVDGTDEIISKYEDKVLNLEDKIISNINQADMNSQIFKIKRQLSYFLKYYKSLNRFIDLIEENYDAISNGSECRHIEIFAIRLERFISDIDYLLEALIHVQDLYTTSLDYSLNNIMKVFTVVTTIFLPLTLITGWYGMNFKNMPELTWKYGYIGVIVFSLVVLLFCIIFFKKKKLF